MITLEKIRNKGVKNAELIYSNPLSCEEDVRDFVMEGSAVVSFPEGHLRLENAIDPSNGQKANYVFWCPKTMPSDVAIEWDFKPLREPGLCMLFFSAAGRNGEDLFAPSLQPRTGEYPLYHHGDINAFHVSYFRRKEPDERAFHTCNLRKSYGFHLVAQGADPIPDAADASGFYHMTLIKFEDTVRFFVNDLEVFQFVDDGTAYGPQLLGGKIGFRQLAPMLAEYADLKVWSLVSDKDAAVKELCGQISALIRGRHGNITLEECAQKLNYHPSYIWKVLKKQNMTFTALANKEKISLAKEYLDQSEYTINEISERLHYSNPQNFIRFFNKYTGMTPGEYRRRA